MESDVLGAVGIEHIFLDMAEILASELGGHTPGLDLRIPLISRLGIAIARTRFPKFRS